VSERPGTGPLQLTAEERGGSAVQRPRGLLARANASEQDRWHRRTYPNLKKKPKP